MRASPGSYLHGFGICGREFSEQRSQSMTKTVPPIDFRWTTNTVTNYKNEPPINEVDEEVWKSIRLAFLSKYNMEISETKDYRYWYWLDGETQAPRGHLCQDGRRRLVVWWERRPLDAPLPLTPGLWPADG